MLEVVTPKITDMSSIKGISALLALPMLCVAYFLQTGANISWDGNVWFGLDVNLPAQVQLNRLVAIFVIKSIWISFFGALAYGLLSYAYVNFSFPVVQLASVLMIAFALFGLFCSDRFPQLQLIDSFWSYSLIAWGLFLQTMKEQLDAERQKIDEMIKQRAKPVQLKDAA